MFQKLNIMKTSDHRIQTIPVIRINSFSYLNDSVLNFILTFWVSLCLWHLYRISKLRDLRYWEVNWEVLRIDFKNRSLLNGFFSYRLGLPWNKTIYGNFKHYKRTIICYLLKTQRDSRNFLQSLFSQPKLVTFIDRHSSENVSFGCISIQFT